MNISAINDSQNFTGIVKRKMYTKDGVLTKFISKGKEVGRHFISDYGTVTGNRTFADGVKLKYSTSICNVDGKQYYSVFLEANGKFKSNPGLFNKSYSVEDEYVKNNPNLFTRKGIEQFALLRSQLEKAGMKLAQSLGL